MKNREELLELLKSDVKAFNAYRGAYPDQPIAFSAAELEGLALKDANLEGVKIYSDRKGESKGKKQASSSDSPQATLAQKPKHQEDPWGTKEFLEKFPIEGSPDNLPTDSDKKPSRTKRDDSIFNTPEFLEKFPVEGSPQYKHVIKLLKQGGRLAGPNQPEPHRPLTPPQKIDKKKEPVSSGDSGEKAKKTKAPHEMLDESIFDTPEFQKIFPKEGSEQYERDIELLKQGRLKRGKRVAAPKPKPAPAPKQAKTDKKKDEKWVNKSKKDKPGTSKGKNEL